MTRHSQPSTNTDLVTRAPDDIFVHSVSNPVLNSHQHSSHDSNTTLNSNFNGTQSLRLIFLNSQSIVLKCVSLAILLNEHDPDVVVAGSHLIFLRLNFSPVDTKCLEKTGEMAMVGCFWPVETL